MRKLKTSAKTLSKHFGVFVILTMMSLAAYSQCNTTVWRGRSIDPRAGVGCTSPWANAGQYVNNGVLQMLANQTCSPQYYYPDFNMTSNLCVTNNFTYEIRLRNLNPAPVNLSAYDVYLQILAANNVTTGVTLMDGGAAHNWAQPFTRLFAGAAQTTGLACLRPNLNNWTIVRLQYQNNVLTCFINGVQCAQVSYTANICNLTGLNVMFKGSGEVDWIRILDAAGTQIWIEDFYATLTPGCFTPFPACVNAALNPNYLAPTCTSNILSLFANPNQTLSTFSWTGPNGFTSTQQNPVINNPTTANNGTYIVTGQLNACSPVVTDTVIVNFSLPSITSNIPDASMCNGDTLQLTASGGGTYSWSPNTNISNVTVSNPLVWPNTTTNYIVTITNGTCTKIDTVLVTVNNCIRCTDSCYWNLLGNSLVTPANFLGTTNNADLKIRTNNRERMIISSAGNVGINLSASQVPNARLHVNNDGFPNTRLQNLPNSRQPANLFIDGNGFVFMGRRSIFGRESDDADKDIEERFSQLQKHTDNISSNFRRLEFHSDENLTIINDMQTMVTNLSNQVNEMQSQMEVMQEQINNCGCYNLKSAQNPAEQKSISEKAKIISVNPNPFAKTTIAHYSIPETTQKAELRLMSISGMIIKSFTITNKSPKGYITISEPLLSKGSYLLVLVADGKIADSKIILTSGN
jgi:hypothetical protein